MITPIGTLNINQICERKNDLLVSTDDVKELARNERNKAIDEFVERLKSRGFVKFVVDQIAKEMRGE